MNIESLRTKLTKDFTDYYSEEGLAVIKDYCENENEVLYFIVSDRINRSCSGADTVLLNLLKNKLKINDIDKELHAALCGKLAEISNKKNLSNLKPFAFIKKCDPAQVIDLLQREMPQTIAVVLSFLEVNMAALLLKYFPGDMQVEIARRISIMDRVETETIREIERTLEKKLFVMKHEDTLSYSGGVESIVEIIISADRVTEKQIIEKLEDEDPELAEEIKKRLFVFSDIVMLDDRAIQKVMREVDSLVLAKALKNANVEVQNKIFRNLSKRAAAMLKEEMEYMGPIRLSDVEDAQSKIVSIIRYLEETGEIIVARAGDDFLVDGGISGEKASIDELPYDTMTYLLLYSKKEIFENLDDDTLAVSLFGADKYQKEMVYKKLKFNKKMKVKIILKTLNEIWVDEVRDAQITITDILKENFDENDIKSKETMTAFEVIKD